MFYLDSELSIEQLWNKLASIRLQSILPLDWLAILAAEEDTCSVIYQECYTETAGASISSILSKHMRCFTGEKQIADVGKDQAMMILPLPALQENFYVACLSLSDGYTENQLDILELFVSTMYENLLLNEQITRENNYLQKVLDTTGSAIMSINRNGIITTANKSSKDFFCLNNIVGKKYDELFQCEDVEKMRHAVNHVLRSNESCVMKEVIIPTLGDSYLVLSMTVSPC